MDKRKLCQREVELLNRIKAQGPQLLRLVEDISEFLHDDNVDYGTPDAESRAWLLEGKMELQKGLMSLTRSIARPESF